MKILITGASGFIGRATAGAAPPETTVHAVVRHGSAPPGLPTFRIPDLGSTEWDGILRDVDAVIHLAARVHMMREEAGDPLAEYRRVNVEGTRRLAEAAAEAGVRRFVFVSSVKVHGETTDGRPFGPESPLRPVDPYGRSKAEAEEVLRGIEGRIGLAVTVVRPPLVYGPGARANFLDLLRVVDRGLPLPLGRAKGCRSLVYVGNLADFLIHCVGANEAAGGSFLVSDGAPIPTPDLIRAIARSLGRPARLLPVPPAIVRAAGRLTGQAERVEKLLGSLEVDDSAVRERLGWSPPTSFEQGLAETADWYRRSEADRRSQAR